MCFKGVSDVFLLELIGEYLSGIMLLAGYVSGNASFPKPLTAEEEREYLKLYRDGDKNARNVLIERNLRLVAHIAKKYADERTLEDYISIGTIGLIKGIDTFNQEKKCRLSSYTARCIENEILMHLRSTKRLQNEISIEESIGSDKEGNNMTFSDILPAEGDDIADTIWSKIETAKLYRAMKNALTAEERDILCWRYGLNHTKRKTQKEIADIMGISRSYVSRIEKRCLKKLSDVLKESPGK